MPKIVRTKEVEFEGLKIKIAPLTLEQVEQYVAPLEEIAANGGAAKIRSYDLICNSLNNALQPGEEHWTHERLRAELDMPLYEFLHSQVLEYSGFKLISDKVAVPGESSAVVEQDKSQGVEPENLPASTSGTSAAA